MKKNKDNDMIYEFLESLLMEQENDETVENDPSFANPPKQTSQNVDATRNISQHDQQEKSNQNPAQPPINSNSAFLDLKDAKIKNIDFKKTMGGSEIKIYTHEHPLPFVLSISPNDVKLQKPPVGGGTGEVIILK